MIKYSKGIALALLIAAVFCLLPGCGGKSAGGLAAIQDKGVLTVATSPDFPPFESLENGEVAGIEVDILEKIAESLGVTLQIEQMDFESVIPGVQAGKFDVGMSGITITEKRKENVDFSEPYFLAAQTIVVPAGSGNDDEEEDLEVSILRSVEENGEEFLEAIEDDAELEEVYSALMDLIYEEDDAPEA